MANKKQESKEPKAQKNAVKQAKKQTKVARQQPQSRTELDFAFNQAIDRFRRDFEELLFPYEEIAMLPEFPEIRTPAVDLQERKEDFVLKAEMPGFKKDDVEISLQEDGVEISAVSGWKYDENKDTYICKERACKSFYRYIDLPAEIKAEDASANLSDGVLEITLPKKAPKPQKQRRKVQVK
jgi:HSP20 family protein